jgi:hypothetical protein
MSVTQIKTYEWRCDHCGAIAVSTARNKWASQPKGWVFRVMHNSGATGYTRELDWCPECARKQE